MKLPDQPIPGADSEPGVEVLCNLCGETCWRFVRTMPVSCSVCGGFDWSCAADNIEEEKRREAIVKACPACDDTGCSGEAPLEPPEAWGPLAAHVEYLGDYMSDPLGDWYRYSFDLCENCLVWLFGQFKLPVTVTEGMPHEGKPVPNEPPAPEEATRVTALGRQKPFKVATFDSSGRAERIKLEQKALQRAIDLQRRVEEKHCKAWATRDPDPWGSSGGDRLFGPLWRLEELAMAWREHHGRLLSELRAAEARARGRNTRRANTGSGADQR